MNRGAYTAANGMIAQQQRLDVLSNNLANVNTRGFKGDRLTFGDMMVRTLADDAGYGQEIAKLSSGPEAQTGVQVTDFSAGGIETTGNPLDFRLDGRTVGMFAVQHGKDVRYTRNGSFTLTADGALVTKDGDPVLDDAKHPIVGLNGPLTTKGGRITVGGATIDLGQFVGRFDKDGAGGNLYRSADARTADPRDEVTISSGELETANVNPVLAMVDLIAIQRSYEIAQKMVQSQDDSTAKLAETMN